VRRKWAGRFRAQITAMGALRQAQGAGVDMFHLMSHYLPMDGYGYGAIKIAEALERLVGNGVDVVDMQPPEGGFYKVGEMRWLVPWPACALTVPEWYEEIETSRLVGYTMFESTLMPQNKVDLINGHCDACIVPCTWCAEMFKAQGVNVPVHVAKWGVDANDYWPIERSGRDGPYTFLWSGTPDLRKGWDLAYKAFWKAFGKSRDVRLILHFRHIPRGLNGVDDENVDVVSGLFDRPILRKMLAEADCFVFPSRGEGWGSPPREAAATGLPVIATNWGGLAEEIEHWALPLRVARLAPAAYNDWDAGEIGEWAEPDLDHLVELMRWCERNRMTATAKGAAAAMWLAGNATWERTARVVVGVMEAGG
jgi:glycosyltransferase involved in cell wall biosynthesis